MKHFRWILPTLIALSTAVFADVHPLATAVSLYAQHMPGKLSVCYIDLASGDYFGFHDGLKLNPASVIKVPVMAAAYYYVDRGQLSLDDRITLGAKDKLWGSGVLVYQKPGQSYTLRALIELMITQSDNTATRMVIRHIGIADINHAFSAMELTNTRLGTSNLLQAQGLNYTTALDMSTLLARIAKEELISPAASKDMMGVLSRQKIRWGIPSGLPRSVAVANKTGSLTGIRSDCAVVMAAPQPYILTVMTQNMPNNQRAKQAVIEISEMAYRFASTVPSRLGLHWSLN
ncbi:MAG: serine hydrolase [Candidatus Margulisiibacteriota bacterium]